MILPMEKIEIIQEYMEGKSIKRIARESGIARNTIRKYIRENEELTEKLKQTIDQIEIAKIQREICSPPKRKKVRYNARVFNGDVEKRFKEIIAISEEKDRVLGPNKQNLTATRIWEILNSEGYSIGKTTIANAYRKYKEKTRECYVRQEYDYGYRVEYDFHIIKLKVGDKIKKYHQVTFVCPKSDYVYELLYENEKKDVVIESIIRFINHCGGVFRTIVFDNTRSVVKSYGRKAEDKEYVDELVKLSSYYHFRIETTNARSGNEKGSVENGGKYSRNQFFSLKYEFNTEEELYIYHAEQLRLLNKDKEIEWEKEKAALLPSPAEEYIIQSTSNNKVNTYSCICIENNFYSVPEKYVGEMVDVSIFGEYIVVYKDNIEIARHKKIKGFHEYKLEINHFLNTFSRKPGALKHSVALKQAPEDLRRIFNDNYSTKPKEFIEYLKNGTLNISNDTCDCDEIEEKSKKQLEDITNIFEMESMKK